MITHPRVARVEWTDSNTTGDAWKSIAEIAETGAGGVKDPCVSVGFVIVDEPACIVLVPHLAAFPLTEDTEGAGDMTIPRVAILKMEYLS